MSFLRCRTCNWSQDDFWDKDHNPIKSLKDWEETLLREDLSSAFPSDERDESWRTVIVMEMKHATRRVATMRYRTRADAEKAGMLCPICKKATLTED